MPKIEAIVDTPFGVGVQIKGSQFDATDQEAKILVALNRAKLVKAEDLVKKPAPETAPKNPGKKPGKKPGEYNRRDMKAKG